MEEIENILSGLRENVLGENVLVKLDHDGMCALCANGGIVGKT